MQTKKKPLNERVSKFTALGVQGKKPKLSDEGELVRYEVTDGTGLRLFVFPSGAKSWGLRYRPPGSRKPTKIMFGKFPAMGLAQARVAVANARLVLDRGIDPAAAKRAAKVADDLAVDDSLRAVAERYLKMEAAKPADKLLRTLGQRRAILERLVFDKIGGRPIKELRRSELIRLLDDIAEQRGPRMADEVLGTLRVIFNWHRVRDEDFHSPIVAGMARTSPTSRRRTRVLDEAELRKVWLAAGTMPGAFGKFVRFLVLTATRRNEAARMKWAEVSGTDWVIPAARYKNKLDHLVPLSRAAQQLLAEVPVIAGCEFVFTTDGRRAFSDFNRGKQALDKASGVVGWRLHDLRRVSRSLLSHIGIDANVSERCLGHVPKGISNTYDRHQYYNEKARAFEALAAQIDLIVHPPAGNVVSIRG